LVPLGFSPLRSGEPVQEVSGALPLLNSAWGEDAEAGGGRLWPAGGRGPRLSGAGGGVRADVFSEPRPYHFPRSSVAWTGCRDRGSGQQWHPRGCQGHGCMIPAPDGRHIGLPYQYFFNQDSCVVNNFGVTYCSFVAVVFSGSLVAKGPKKLCGKMSCS
jgi:hypothetical protein